MKKGIIIFLFLGLVTHLQAGSFSLPSDLPTIEALINLHKLIAKGCPQDPEYEVEQCLPVGLPWWHDQSYIFRKRQYY